MLFNLKTHKKLCKRLIRHYGFDLVFHCKDGTARWRDGLEHDTCRQGEWTYTITCFSPSPLPFHFMSALPSPDFHKLFTLHVCIFITCFSASPLPLHVCIFITCFSARPLQFDICFAIMFSIKSFTVCHYLFFSRSFAVSCFVFAIASFHQGLFCFSSNP